MNLKISKINYLVSSLFLSSFLTTPLQSGFNIREILYFFFSLPILQDIIHANIIWISKNTKINQFSGFLYLYFLGHPLIITFLTLSGFDGLLQSFSITRILISSMSITFQVFIGIFFIVNLDYKSFIQIKKIICIFALGFLIEYLLAILFSSEYAFDQAYTITNIANAGGLYSSKFIGFIDSAWLITLVALLSFHFSITEFLSSKRFIYLLLSLCFIYLGYICKLRIFFLALIIYIFLTIAFFIKNKKQLYLFFLSSFITFSLLFLNIDFNSSFFESLYDRLYLYAKQINLIANNFLFGVGGNMSEKYHKFTNAFLADKLSDFLKIDLLSDRFFRSQFHGFAKRSTHSTLLDIIGDYGILGIYISFFSIAWPLRILKRVWKFYHARKFDIEVRQGSIILLSLLGFYLLQSSGQYLWVIILMMAYLLNVSNYHMTYNKED